ncbi:hypothetical protein BKA69DRAFT_357574 [Paraphysoderma sedebokerense]|nr:hypothetical protein BKA69DRAFT_357574 [Paraphysoderma sedebokerense]
MSAFNSSSRPAQSIYSPSKTSSKTNPEQTISLWSKITECWHKVSKNNILNIRVLAVCQIIFSIVLLVTASQNPPPSDANVSWCWGLQIGISVLALIVTRKRDNVKAQVKNVSVVLLLNMTNGFAVCLYFLYVSNRWQTEELLCPEPCATPEPRIAAMEYSFKCGAFLLCQYSPFLRASSTIRYIPPQLCNLICWILQAAAIHPIVTYLLSLLKLQRRTSKDVKAGYNSNRNTLIS